MATKLQKVNQMKTKWLHSLSNEELNAIADKDLDLSALTGQELDSIISGTASWDLLHRVKATRITK
jgi:hypothetical protein